MPIFNKQINKNDNIPVNSAGESNVSLDDIQINDFSDDIDLGGLGNLLSDGISTGNYDNSSVQPPLEESKLKKFGNLLGKIADKLKKPEQREDIPQLPKEYSAQDPNYISETVSFADTEQDFYDWQKDNNEFSQVAQNQSDDMMNYDNAQNDYTQSEQQYITYDVYSPQYQEPVQEVSTDIPHDYYNSQNQPAQSQSHTVNTPNGEIFSPQWSDFDEDFGSQDFLSGNYNYSEPMVSKDEPVRASEEIEPAERRSHDIMGAVRDRIRQFRKRLPSFKPKEYQLPEPKYNEKDDKLAKSPSLMADVQRYINSQEDLGEVSREYEQMRQYIQSVNTNTNFSRREINPPENIHEIYTAQNELFDMINDINAKNEEQRSRIGVYAAREEEDPYNYRGINDSRQNYSDIEYASFSMAHGIDFESEKNISLERNLYLRHSEFAQDDVAMDDDFDEMPNEGVNSQGGLAQDYFSSGMSDDFVMENDFDNSGDNFSDDFDDDFDTYKF